MARIKQKKQKNEFKLLVVGGAVLSNKTCTAEIEIHDIRVVRETPSETCIRNVTIN